MLSRLFGPKEHTLKINGDTATLVVNKKQKILGAALDAGLEWPHDCRVGSCGSCRCVLKTGKIKPLIDFSYTLTQEEIQRGVILACQSVLRSDAEIEVLLDANAAQTSEVNGTITGLKNLTHDIVEVLVTLDSPAFAASRAGQYFDIGCASVAAPRSYSLALSPVGEALSELLFTIRHVPGGEFTDWLFAADRCGERISVSGPYGQFYLRAAGQPVVCIAGGSGLAPIKALVEQGVREQRRDACTVLFGARTQADLYYLDELEALGQQWRGDFRLVPVLSDEAANSDWQGARGLVTSVIQDISNSDQFAAGQAYLCGPPPMVDAAIEELKKHAMPQQNIFFDKFLDASTLPGGR